MIRKAQIADLPKIWETAARLHEKSSYRDVPKDLQTFAQTLGNCINNAFGFAVVAEHDGEITGFLLGAAVPLWFSKKRCASDIVTYAETPGDGVKMGRVFLAWAWAIPQVIEVTMAQSSGIDVDRTGVIYERLGLEKVGGLYMAVRPPEAKEKAA